MAPSLGRRTILIAIGLVALAAVLWLIADAIVIALRGIVLASVLLSLSSPLSRATHLGARWSRLIVVLLMLAAVAAMSWLFGNEVATQFGELQRRLPEALPKVEEWFGRSPAGRMVVDSVRQVGDNTQALSQAGAFVCSVFGAAANLLRVLFLGVNFAADPPLYRDGALRLAPPRRRPQLRRALDDAGVALRKWLVAQVVAMVAVGVLTGVALGLIGVPGVILAMPLAVVVMILVKDHHVEDTLEARSRE